MNHIFIICLIGQVPTLRMDTWPSAYLAVLFLIDLYFSLCYMSNFHAHPCLRARWMCGKCETCLWCLRFCVCASPVGSFLNHLALSWWISRTSESCSRAACFWHHPFRLWRFIKSWLCSHLVIMISSQVALQVWISHAYLSLLRHMNFWAVLAIDFD